MKKKILAIIVMFVLTITSFTNIYAKDGMFDSGFFNKAYRLSKESEIDLPFLNFFEKSATYDKRVTHSGISFGQSTIDIDEKMEGMHLIFSQDMVTVKGEIEHGIVYGKNIVIEGKILNDTILMGDTVKITENAVIEKDIIVVSPNFTMSGIIKGNLIAATNTAVINGTIEKDLRIETANIDIENSIINDEVYLSVPEGTNINKIKEKYPAASINVISTISEQEDVKLTGEEIMNVVLDGLKVVIVYTLVSMLLVKKEKGITTKMTARFLEHSTFGIFASVGAFALSILIIILLAFLGFIGYGVLAWPLLIVYIAVLLLSLSICQLVVGLVLYEVLKKKIGKYKLPALIGIFGIIYSLTKLPGVAPYMVIAINVLSLAIVITYMFKKEETSYFLESIEVKEKENNKIEENENKEQKTENNKKEDKK